MRKCLAALLTVALCLITFNTSQAQNRVGQLITKRAKWCTWGPNGPVDGTVKDTASIASGTNGVDTTAAIYIGDYDIATGGLHSGPGAVTASQGLKVFIVSDGAVDDIDSLYFRVEQSVDGVHWDTPAASNQLNQVVGCLAGFDQGGSIVTTGGNCLVANLKIDTDNLDGASATALTFSTSYEWAPYIRIVVITDATSTNVLNAARLFVTYPGFREETQ